ncbi:MAG: TPM domain-containing protein [Chloroflexota bacterium]
MAWRILRCVSIALTAIFTIALLSQLVFAQTGYPQRIDPFINDFASVLKWQDQQDLAGQLQTLANDKDIEMTLVTVHQISDYDTPYRSIEQFAKGLFRAWQIGDQNKGNGVLLLVAIQDRKVRIEMGAGYGRTLDHRLQRVVSQDMLPLFRTGDFSAGIHQGTLSTIDIIRASAISTPSIINNRNGKAWGVVAFIVIVVGTVGFIILHAIWSAKKETPSSRWRTKRRFSSSSSVDYAPGASSGGNSTGGGASGDW